VTDAALKQEENKKGSVGWAAALRRAAEGEAGPTLVEEAVQVRGERKHWRQRCAYFTEQSRGE
jgi:hypothetical protein